MLIPGLPISSSPCFNGLSRTNLARQPVGSIPFHRIRPESVRCLEGFRTSVIGPDTHGCYRNAQNSEVYQFISQLLAWLNSLYGKVENIGRDYRRGSL